jgi:acyl-CoA hydrolase
VSPRELNPAEAAALLHTTDTIGLPLGPGQPPTLIHALGDRTDWVALEVLSAILVDFYELPNRPGVRTLSTFFGPAERLYRDAGADIHYIPADYRRYTRIFEERRPRVMATMAAPPDSDGYLSLSLHAGATVDELHHAGADPDRMLMVEVSEAFPRTVGLGEQHPHRLHLDEVDVLIRTERVPVVFDIGPMGSDEVAIAELAQRFVRDGSTIQTGFGSIPSAIATVLADGDGGDYGIHSEMFTTGLMQLCRAGKVTNAHKSIFEGLSVTSFAAGIPELYSWLDGRTDVAFAPVSVVNDPAVIAGNHHMVTINGAISVDLYGQVSADTVGPQQYSGVGGHEDFVSASGLDLSDRSLICLPSTAALHDGTRTSRIVASLPTGAPVSTPRHQTDVVITEHGVAELRGRTVADRAQALASIAHPDFRDQLLAAAAAWPAAPAR